MGIAPNHPFIFMDFPWNQPSIFEVPPWLWQPSHQGITSPHPRIRRSVLRLIEALQHAQLHIEIARAAPETAQQMEKATGKNTKPILDGKNTTHKSGDDFRDGVWHGFNHIRFYDDDKMLEIYNDPIIEKYIYIYIMGNICNIDHFQYM